MKTHSAEGGIAPHSPAALEAAGSPSSAVASPECDQHPLGESPLPLTEGEYIQERERREDAAGSPSSAAFTRWDLVEIQANRPMGVVTGERPDPDAPGELLYAVTTWRSASELRRVLERRGEVARG